MSNPNIDITQADESVFDARDVTDSQYYIRGTLVSGYLRFDVVAETAAGERGSVRGIEFFDAVMAHFGDKITAIEGDWSDLFPELTANLRRFNELTALGIQYESAALQTWTGRMAERHGFTLVEIKRALPPKAVGKFREVFVYFRKSVN